MYLLSKFFEEESGATAIEYALLLVLIALLLVGSFEAVGTDAKGNLDGIGEVLSVG